jgi:hypothetical protein
MIQMIYPISGYVLDQKHIKIISKGYQTLGYQPLHHVGVPAISHHFTKVEKSSLYPVCGFGEFLDCK